MKISQSSLFRLLILLAACQTSWEKEMQSEELLVIDTDGGVDDAAAILLALSQENIRVLAFTCCFGNTILDNVCLNIRRLLTVCQETQIPIYRGSRESLIRSPNDVKVFGSDGFGNVSHEFPTGDAQISDVPAALALIQLAKDYPGRINLVVIGPLTNIAIAHRIDPEFTKNLKSIFCMGGNYKGIGNVNGVAEFNFYSDPESANIVLSEAECPMVLVPWETVTEFGMTWEIYSQLEKMRTTKGKFFKRISQLYVDSVKKKGKPRFYDCDFMAMAALLRPDSIAASIERAAVVECGGFFCRGLTVLLNEERDEIVTKSRVKIVTAFDEAILNALRPQMLS